MKEFVVCLETKVSKWVNIKAEGAEEAVAIAKRDHCKQTVDVKFAPTWLDLTERAKESDELSMEVVGSCDKCGVTFIHRHYVDDDGKKEEHPEGWPWLYGSPSQAQVGEDKNPDYFLWCYRCLQSPLEQLAECAE